MEKDDSKVNDSNISCYSSDDEDENSSTFRKLCEKLLFDLEKSNEKCLNLEKENTALKEKVTVLENDLKDSKLVVVAKNTTIKICDVESTRR